MLDGRIARWRREHSALGRELDSLSDIISFGVAPAALAYAAGLRGGWDIVALIYFVCCGVSRLARYNVTAEALSADSGKVKYFEGTPIPTTVLLTAVLAFAAWKGTPRRESLRRQLDDRSLGAASAGAVVRRIRHADGQQDAAHPQALVSAPRRRGVRKSRPTTVSESTSRSTSVVRRTTL